MNLTPTGQHEAFRKLVSMENSLPACLILTGPAGVGKRQAVRALFQKIHCANNHCGSCASCLKITNNNHLDFISIEPEGENISAESLREMKKNLYFAPVEGKIRFVLINDAHKLNATSANMLLKTLEEPPKHTRFFLITHQKNLLLPTILSRSQFLFFQPLEERILRHMLLQTFEQAQLTVSDSTLTTIISLMNGGLEKLEFFKNEKTLEFLNLILSNKSDVLKELHKELNEDWKIELLLDYLIFKFHQQSKTQIENPSPQTSQHIFHLSQGAFYASFLQNRLSKAANKKLVALAASDLAYSHA